MDLDKLRALVELDRRGTMGAVAVAIGYGTSAVSQQLAALERQVGVPLLEASGRRVRLTPAGRRLAEHGVGILSAVTAAELDVAARSAPHGVVRIAGHTMALQRYLIPAVRDMETAYPDVQLELQEREPPEVIALLDDDHIDLGFVYEYSLVPRVWRHPRTFIHRAPMVLAVPDDADVPDSIRSPADLEPFREFAWIANSRDSADDELTHRLCALGGWLPTIRHRADSLDLVVDLVLAGQGISVLVADAPAARGVRTVTLELGSVERRIWGVVRAGSLNWPATTAVINQVLSRIPGRRHRAADRFANPNIFRADSMSMASESTSRPSKQSGRSVGSRRCRRLRPWLDTRSAGRLTGARARPAVWCSRQPRRSRWCSPSRRILQ